MISDRTAISGFASVLLALVGGCGTPANQLDTAPVTGRVTLNGEPVTSGYIYTSPRRGRLATAKINEDGSFSLGTYKPGDGASIGEHTVMLAPAPSVEGPVPENAVVPPEKYGSASTSGLTISVPPEGLKDYVIALVDDGSDARRPAEPVPFE